MSLQGWGDAVSRPGAHPGTSLSVAHTSGVKSSLSCLFLQETEERRGCVERKVSHPWTQAVASAGFVQGRGLRGLSLPAHHPRPCQSRLWVGRGGRSPTGFVVRIHEGSNPGVYSSHSQWPAGPHQCIDGDTSIFQFLSYLCSFMQKL